MEFEHFVKQGEEYVKEQGFRVLGIYAGDQVPQEEIAAIKRLIDNQEEVIAPFFNGADYTIDVDIINGVADYSSGVQFTDHMGQQAVRVYPVFEDAMLNRIMDLTDQADGKVLSINSNTKYALPYDIDGKEYKPINVVKRDADIDNPNGEDFIYDAEFLMREVDENDKGIEYVSSIEVVDWALLYAIYRELI